MSKSTWVLGCSALVLIPILLLAIYFFQPWIFNPTMPLYTYNRYPSSHPGYTRHVLTRNNITYESDYTEYGLTSPGDDHQIGQTSKGARLITIYGQKDWIVLYDFMDVVAVFRNSNAPPLNLATAGVTDMLLTPLGSGLQKSTKDIILIKDVITTLSGGTRAISSSGAAGSPERYVLYLSGGKLAGMKYCAGVYKDKTGQFYLATDTYSKDWYPASQGFADWAR